MCCTSHTAIVCTGQPEAQTTTSLSGTSRATVDIVDTIRKQFHSRFPTRSGCPATPSRFLAISSTCLDTPFAPPHSRFPVRPPELGSQPTVSVSGEHLVAAVLLLGLLAMRQA